LCKACNSISNCITCSKSAIKDTKCDVCASGYRLEGSDTLASPTLCRKCNVLNCDVCTDNIDSCITCRERFVLWAEAITNDKTGV